MDERHFLSFVRMVWRFRYLISTILVGGWGGMVEKWNWFTGGMRQVTTGEQVYLMILIVLSALFLALMIVALRRGLPDVHEGFRNRDHLHRAYGSIEDEFLMAKQTINICWDSGSIAARTNVFANPEINKKIKKVILLGTQHLQTDNINMTHSFDGELIDKIIAEIKEANQQGAAIELRYMTGNLFLPTMIIFDPEDSLSGWLRMEITSPLIVENRRPSIIFKRRSWIDYILRRNGHRGAFVELSQMYDRIFQSLSDKRPTNAYA